jgi:uncharacterized protein
VSRPPAAPCQAVPAPISQFVLKVHSRCDLACDHCYVYEAADQSWRGRPAVISGEVTARAAERIAEHAAAHALPGVQVILHGGEPLLAGPARLRQIITALRSALSGACQLDLRIHTNGVLLTPVLCELFAEHQVKVGVSIDGDRPANDRHRRYADGRSSYDKVIAAISLLRTGRFRPLYAGLLCTIDVANDPLAVYQALMELAPPRIDFLLPHATWDHPPPRRPGAGAEYADWLIAIFDRWAADGCPVPIRTFDSIGSTLRGGENLTEALGLGPAGLVVIETDGSYEQADSLKAAYQGAPETGMDVLRHPLDAVAAHPGILARQQGLAGLCQACRQCPVVTSCGGGLYTHRYRTGTGFANPSAYCADLLKLITHIGSRPPGPRPGGPGPRRTAHTISSGDFRALAAGPGSAAAVAGLIEAQRSLVRGLLSAVYQQAEAAPGLSPQAQADLRAAWSVLTELDHAGAPGLAQVLGHPGVRRWAERCLSAPRDRGDAGPPAGLGHLGAIAAAAAIASAATATAAVPVTGGAVHLPSLGRLAAGPGGEHERAVIEVAGNAVSVRLGPSRWTLAGPVLAGPVLAGPVLAGPQLAGSQLGTDLAGLRFTAADGRQACWQPVRTLAGPGIRVALDDTDPCLLDQPEAAAPRLTDVEFARWQRCFTAAWQQIRAGQPGYGAALAAGLSTIVPLAGPALARTAGRGAAAGAAGGATAGGATAGGATAGGATARGAAARGAAADTGPGACRPAFGAVALALPAGPVTLAERLIREFQHVKLAAVTDLYDLYDRAGDGQLPVASQPGQHPLGALLHDAYAGLAVTGFWRARQQAAAGPEAEQAGQRFARWRASTRDAIETLAASGLLTPLGTWFVREMRDSAS